MEFVGRIDVGSPLKGPPSILVHDPLAYPVLWSCTTLKFRPSFEPRLSSVGMRTSSVLPVSFPVPPFDGPLTVHHSPCVKSSSVPVPRTNRTHCSL